MDQGAPDKPSTTTRVLIAVHGLVYARSLQDSLEQRGVAVSVWQLTPETPLDSDRALAAVDVLLVDADELSDAELSLVECARERFPLVEIVALSSNPGIEGAVQALRDGFYTILLYPVSDDELTSVINDACARKRRGEQRIKDLESPRVRRP